MEEKTKLDILRDDFKFQLETADDIDWDYFLEIATQAQSQANFENRNMVEI